MDPDKIFKEFSESLTKEELDQLSGVFSLAKNERELKRDPSLQRKIIPIEDWLLSNHYLGSMAESLYPYWRREIADFINGNYSEWVIDGSIGTGKSTAALIAVMYKLYELSCYAYPQRLFKLADITKIIFAYLSVSQTVATATGFGQFMEMVDSVPHFRQVFARDKTINSTLKFPQRIDMVSGSNVYTVIGTNLFGMIFDEANFQKKGGSSWGGDLEKAQHIYTETTDRRRSRFMNEGKDPSFSILVSSTTVHSSFTEKRKELGGAEVKVTNSRLWDVKPPGTYGTKKFFVYTGSETVDPMMISSAIDLIQVQAELKNTLDAYLLEKDPTDVKVIQNLVEEMPDSLQDKVVSVPEDFRDSFETDVVGALRNLAGVSIAPLGKLFNSETSWTPNILHDISHPFDTEKFVVSMKIPGDLTSHFNHNKLFKAIYSEDEEAWELRRHPDAPRFFHIDQSTTNDCTGIACCHRAGYTEDTETGAKLPIIEFDFILQIVPPKRPDKISISKVRKFVFDLRNKWGMPVGKVTYDQFQSFDSIQTLQTNGFNAELLSVDRDDKQYLYFCDLLYQTRVRMYKYPLFKEEFFNLDHDRLRQKVDHDSEHSKDISDAVVGAAWNCLEGGSSSFEDVMDTLSGLQISRTLQDEEDDDDESWLLSGYDGLKEFDKTHLKKLTKRLDPKDGINF